MIFSAKPGTGLTESHLRRDKLLPLLWSSISVTRTGSRPDPPITVWLEASYLTSLSIISGRKIINPPIEYEELSEIIQGKQHSFWLTLRICSFLPQKRMNCVHAQPGMKPIQVIMTKKSRRQTTVQFHLWGARIAQTKRWSEYCMPLWVWTRKGHVWNC